SGAMTHEFLEQFCGDFIRMLAKLLQEKDFRDILIQPEIQDSFSLASESLEGTLAFIRRILQQLPAFEGKDSEKDQMNRIVEYIQQHLSEELRRSDIAEAVYLNPDYLSRLFRKEKGMSLKEYIICEKMKTAQAILRSTNLPVAVVAARVGFENYSYFSQVYKKVIGVNPSAERSKNPDT
ncbi:helix-turn-helix transcriptional regulator, partial [Neglectibacter timonensis]